MFESSRNKVYCVIFEETIKMKMDAQGQWFLILSYLFYGFLKIFTIQNSERNNAIQF